MGSVGRHHQIAAAPQCVRPVEAVTLLAGESWRRDFRPEPSQPLVIERSPADGICGQRQADAPGCRSMAGTRVNLDPPGRAVMRWSCGVLGTLESLASIAILRVMEEPTAGRARCRLSAAS